MLNLNQPKLDFKKSTLSFDNSVIQDIVRDPNGNIVSLSSQNATWSYQYNSLDKVDQEALSVNGSTYVIEWGYDNLGNISSLTYPNGELVSFQPDALGRPTKSGAYATNVEYHPSGVIKSFDYGNNLSRSVDVSASGRIIKIRDFYNIGYSKPSRFNYTYTYDKEGNSISDETMQIALDSDAVLFGAVGGSKWDNVEREKRPEAALLRLRKDLDLFANLRPAVVLDALAESSSLKSDLVQGLDILIVRELTSGVYFGQPRGISKISDTESKAIDTQVYTTSEIERVSRVAFDLAKLRRNKVSSAEKSNVMETGLFWRNIVTDLHKKEYASVNLEHILADNCAMQLVRYPKQFDVILTDNLFGDLLSDTAAMLTGSLGMLPSASLGPLKENGSRAAMYEPVHGSAPDIAGKNIANPLAMIMSFAMMLKYSFDLIEESNLIETAVKNVLSKGYRTLDIKGINEKAVSTTGMGQAVIEELNNLIGK